MNLPNQLTIGRLVISALFVVVLSLSFHGSATLALVLFVVGGLTDYADGRIARARNLVTNFGKLMDPLADKIMVSAAFIFLASTRMVPAWFVVLVVSREFLVTGLRLLAAAQGVVLPAERLGKHKMVWQIVAVVFFFLVMTIREWNPEMLDQLPSAGLEAAGWVVLGGTAMLTLVSGTSYLWNNRSLLRDGLKG